MFHWWRSRCVAARARWRRALRRASGGAPSARAASRAGRVGRAAPSDSRARVLPRGAMRRLEICSALSLAQMEVVGELCVTARKTSAAIAALPQGLCFC